MCRRRPCAASTAACAAVRGRTGEPDQAAAPVEEAVAHRMHPSTPAAPRARPTDAPRRATPRHRPQAGNGTQVPHRRHTARDDAIVEDLRGRHAAARRAARRCGRRPTRRNPRCAPSATELPKPASSGTRAAASAGSQAARRHAVWRAESRRQCRDARRRIEAGQHRRCPTLPARAAPSGDLGDHCRACRGCR